MLFEVFHEKNALYNFRNEDPKDLTKIVSLSKSIEERVSLKVNQCQRYNRFTKCNVLYGV